jgi:hypothetical protein
MTTQQEPPQTIQNGVVPRRRINNAREALTVARQLEEDNRKREAKVAAMKALVDGEPPFSSDKLRRNGQGDRSNINPMDAAAHMDTAVVPYYDLFATQRYRCDIETDEGGPEFAAMHSRVMTEEVDTFLRNDPTFEENMRQVIYWRVGFGVGAIMWRDPYSPVFKPVRPDRLRVPQLSMASVSELCFASVVVEYDAVELYRRIEDEDLGAKSGWNVIAVKTAIANAAATSRDTRDYLTAQQLIKNDQYWAASHFAKIQCARLVVKEFDGSISEYIVPLNHEAPTGGGSEEDAELQFLYESHGRYENFHQVLGAFFQETSEGYWHGATGQIHRIFNVCRMKMRMFNAVQDGAFLRAGPTVKALSANALETAQITHHGSLTVLPPQFEVQNSTIFGDLASVMNVSNYNDSVIFQNTGVYRSRMDRPQGNPRTAREVELQFESAAQLSNAAVNHFMSELDCFYNEYVRRLLTVDIDSIKSDCRDKVKELRKKITSRGVPSSAFKNLTRVEAHRGLGAGSRWLKSIDVNDAVLLSQMLPPNGAKAFLEDFIASRYGYKLASRWTGQMKVSSTDERNAWEAQMESTLLQAGELPMIRDDQDDFIHAAVHFKDASAAAMSVQQGANPMAVLAFVQTVGKHNAEHLVRVSQNRFRSKEIKAIEDGIKMLSMVAEGLEKMIQEQQQMAQANAQAQQIEQGLDPETRIKAAKTEADIALKAKKQNATLDLKRQKQQFDLKQKASKAEFDKAITDAKTAHEILLKNHEEATETETATAT